MKKIVLVIMVLFVLATLSVNGAQAAGWYTCTVNQTGVGGNALVQLSATGQFSNRWFVLPAAQASQMLAVTLTAMSSGLHVVVFTDPAVYSTIQTIYLAP